MLQPKNDTEEFEFYLKFAKPLVLGLSDTNERIKAAAWIQKLRKDDANIALRSNYLKLLLFVLQRRKLIGPFGQIPDEDKPLANFPADSNLQDVAKNFVEVDRRILKETLEKGGYGEWPPYNTAHASDMTEYASSQAIPNFGTQVYFAFSKFPIHTWDNFNKCVVPENEKLETKTQIGGDISPDISCFIPEIRPDTPGKRERDDKVGDGDFSWLDSMKTPEAGVSKESKAERDEFDVSDRVPPTWGSNLINIEDSPMREHAPSLSQSVKDQTLDDVSLPSPISASRPGTPRSVSSRSSGIGGDSFMAEDQQSLRWLDSMGQGAGFPKDEKQDSNMWDSFGWWTDDPEKIFQYTPHFPQGRPSSREQRTARQGAVSATPPLFSRDPRIREGPGGNRIYAPQEFGMESFEEPLWKPADEYFKRYPCIFTGQSPFVNVRDQNRQTLDMSKYPAPKSPKMQGRFSDIQPTAEDLFIGDEVAPDLHALSFTEDDMVKRTRAEAIIASLAIGPIETWSPPPFTGTPPAYEPNPEINEEDLEESISKLIADDLAMLQSGVPVTTPKRSPMPRRQISLLSETPPSAPDLDFDDVRLVPSPEMITPPKYIRQPPRRLDYDTNIGTPVKAGIVDMNSRLANLDQRLAMLETIGRPIYDTPPRRPPTPPPMPHLMDAPIPGRRLPAPIRIPPSTWAWKTPPDVKTPKHTKKKLKTPTGIPTPKRAREGFHGDFGLYTESPPPEAFSPAMAIGPLMFSPEAEFMNAVCGVTCPSSPVRGPSGQPILPDWQLEQMGQVYDDELAGLEDSPPELYRSPDRQITPEHLRRIRQQEQAASKLVDDEELERLELEVFGSSSPQAPPRQRISPPRVVPPPITGGTPIPKDYEMRAWQQEIQLMSPSKRLRSKPMTVRTKSGKSYKVVGAKRPTVSPIKDIEFETDELNIKPPRVPKFKGAQVISPKRGMPPVYATSPPSPDAIMYDFGLPSPLRVERRSYRPSPDEAYELSPVCSNKRQQFERKVIPLDFDESLEELPPSRIPTPPPMPPATRRLPTGVAPANWEHSPLRPEVLTAKTQAQLADICRIDVPCNVNLEAEEPPEFDIPTSPLGLLARKKRPFEGQIRLPGVSRPAPAPASPVTPEAEREAWRRQIEEYEAPRRKRKKKVSKAPKLGSVTEVVSAKKKKTPVKYVVPRRPDTPPGPSAVSEAHDILGRIALIRQQLRLLEDTMQQSPEHQAAERPIDINADLELDILDTEMMPAFLETSEEDVCAVVCAPTSDEYVPGDVQSDIGPLLTEQDRLTSTTHPLLDKPTPYSHRKRESDVEVNIGTPYPSPKRRILYKAPDVLPKDIERYDAEVRAAERELQFREREQQIREKREGKLLYKGAGVTQADVQRENQEILDMERKLANLNRRMEILETVDQTINAPVRSPPTPPPMPHIMDAPIPGRRLPTPMLPPSGWNWKTPPDMRRQQQEKKKLLTPTRLPFISPIRERGDVGLFKETPPPTMAICGVESPSSPVKGPSGQPILPDWQLEQMGQVYYDEVAGLEDTPPELYRSPDRPITPEHLRRVREQEQALAIPSTSTGGRIEATELEQLEQEVFATPVRRAPYRGISPPRPVRPTRDVSPIPEQYEMNLWKQQLALMSPPRRYRHSRVMSVRPKSGRAYKVVGAKIPTVSPIQDLEFETDELNMIRTPPRIPKVKDYRVPVISPKKGMPNIYATSPPSPDAIIHDFGLPSPVRYERRTSAVTPTPCPGRRSPHERRRIRLDFDESPGDSPSRIPTPPPLPVRPQPPGQSRAPPANWNWVSPERKQLEYYTKNVVPVMGEESPPPNLASESVCDIVCAEDVGEEEYSDFAIQPEMDIIDLAEIDSQGISDIYDSPPELYTSPERISPRERIVSPVQAPQRVPTPVTPHTPPRRQDPYFDRQKFMESSLYLPKVDVRNRVESLSPETPEEERRAFREGLSQYQPVAYKKKTFVVRPKSKSVKLGAMKPQMSIVQELPYAEIVTPPLRRQRQPSGRPSASAAGPSSTPCGLPQVRPPIIASATGSTQHPMFVDPTRQQRRELQLNTDRDIGQTINVRGPQRVFIGDLADESVQADLQYAREFENKMLNAERRRQLLAQIQDQYKMSPERQLPAPSTDRHLMDMSIPDQNLPPSIMPPSGWGWSSPPEYAPPARRKRPQIPGRGPADFGIQAESPPPAMYSPPELPAVSTAPCASRTPGSPRRSPVRSPGGRPMLADWQVPPAPDVWAMSQTDVNLLAEEYPPLLEDHTPPAVPEYLRRAQEQEALLFSDTSPTLAPRVASPCASVQRSPCASVQRSPRRQAPVSPVNESELLALEMEIFGEQPSMPIRRGGIRRPGRKVGKVRYDPAIVEADELKDFTQLLDRASPRATVMDESIPELLLDYSQMSMLDGIPDYEPEEFNMFSDGSPVDMNIRMPFEGQTDDMFDTSMIDTELRDEERDFKWMGCGKSYPSKK